MINDEQRAARKSGIFSSDVPRIMTGQGATVALEKLGVLQQEDISEVPAVKLGNRFEEPVLQAAVRALELPAGDVILSPDTMRHPSFQWLGCHADAIAPGMVIEAKYVSPVNRRQWGEPGTDEVPDRVMWQVQTQMAVLQLPAAYIPVLFGSEENLARYLATGEVSIELYRVQRSETLIEALIEASSGVWEAVQSGTAPAPVNVGDARIVYAKDTGTIAECDEDTFKAAMVLHDLKAELKRLEAEEAAAKEHIQVAMKTAAELRYKGVTVATWKNAKDSEKVQWEDTCAAALRYITNARGKDARAEDILDAVHQMLATPVRKIVPGSRRFLLKEIKS